jgi:hypothetical protein
MSIDHQEETRRALYMDWLYEQSGRTCGTYTGLYRERIQALIEADMKAALHPENA